MSAAGRTLRAAISTFTIVPVGRVEIGERDGAALLCWLTVIGAGLGAVSGLVFVAVAAINPHAGLLGAVLAVGALALLTRGLHLDGLADTADGLGARAAPGRALEIMRQSDIGPFGVLGIAVVLGIDVAALAEFADHRWRAFAVLVLATTTGRLAVTHAALRGIRAARPDGFGALVAGSHSPLRALLTSVPVLLAGEVVSITTHLNPAAVLGTQLGALLLAYGFRRHVSRRIGGVSGDVFGALVELTTAAVLTGLALAG